MSHKCRVVRVGHWLFIQKWGGMFVGPLGVGAWGWFIRDQSANPWLPHSLVTKVKVPGKPSARLPKKMYRKNIQTYL